MRVRFLTTFEGRVAGELDTLPIDEGLRLARIGVVEIVEPSLPPRPLKQTPALENAMLPRPLEAAMVR